MWKNEKVIVTGGAGVIGKELIKKLLEKGASIRCFDIGPQPKEFFGKVEYCQEDLSTLNPIEFLAFEPDIIFHLAAAFERTEENPKFWDENFRNNIITSHKVIEAANKCSNLKKFIFASSYLIYSPNLYLFPKPQTNPRELKETEPVSPRNLVGVAKYYTEKELEFMSKMFGNFISISARIYRVYGYGSKDVISRWIRMALNGEELIVFQRENMFDYIFAEDVAEGLIKIAENVNEDRIINLGTGTARKVEEIVKNLKEQIPDINIKEIEKLGLFETSCADISNLVNLTGWQAHTTLEEGIRKIVDYERKVLGGK